MSKYKIIVCILILINIIMGIYIMFFMKKTPIYTLQQYAEQMGYFDSYRDIKIIYFDNYNFLKEIGLYCVDDNGNPIDAYNHCCDECRYANNYFYKNYVL